MHLLVLGTWALFVLILELTSVNNCFYHCVQFIQSRVTIQVDALHARVSPSRNSWIQDMHSRNNQMVGSVCIEAHGQYPNLHHRNSMEIIYWWKKMFLCNFILFWTKHNLSVVAFYKIFSLIQGHGGRSMDPLCKYVSIYWAPIMPLLTMTMSLFQQLYFLYVQNKTENRAVKWN
jgi:hypothetical protein